MPFLVAHESHRLAFDAGVGRACAHAWRALAVIAVVLAATLATACDADLTCAETATCPPATDAQSEPGQDGGWTDLDLGDTDSAVVDDGDHRGDRATSDGRDAADDAEGPTPTDASWPDNGSDVERPADDASDGGIRSDGPNHVDAPHCDLDAGRSPSDNPCIVSERYGVFVSPEGSDATGAGTRSAPFRTINRGLQAAKIETMRVFVCDNGAGFIDPITIDPTFEGISLYGGFDCAAWKLAESARTAVHPVVGPALLVSSLMQGVTIESFELRAADAAPGASSIAVQVQSSAGVVLRRSRLLAGKGGAGQTGADGPPGADGEVPGPAQRGRSASCVPPILSQPGGSWGAATCGSKGGSGGACDTTLGSLPGDDGTPSNFVDPPNVANGATHWLADRNGRPGSRGIGGESGLANRQPGSFTATGYALAAPGNDGAHGHAAQGGGGGSSGEADPSNWCIGATGGAGGMGGCGGVPGVGGGAGGASVALLSWTSSVTLDQCEVASGDGGPGGNGGKGGVGGKGAIGAEGGEGVFDPDAGASLVGAGSGGPGGNGGPGGGGAGGNGGPTYAIAYSGARPLQIGGTTITLGVGGVPGAGGHSPVVMQPDGGVADGGGAEGGISEGGATDGRPTEGGMTDGSTEGGATEGGITDGGAGTPDGGRLRGDDGLPGEAAYELPIP